MIKIMSAKDVRRVLDAEIAKRKKHGETVTAEIAAMFVRRAAARYLFHDRWGKDGCAYAK